MVCRSSTIVPHFHLDSREEWVYCGVDGSAQPRGPPPISVGQTRSAPEPGAVGGLLRSPAFKEPTLPRKIEYLVDGIWPRRRPNLIAGASGAGKTRFIVPWLFAWLEGKPILGRPTRKLNKIAYICCDRTSEDAMDTMDSMGYDPSRLFIYSFMDNEVEWSLGKVIDVIPPHTEFTFIEAIGALVQHAKINDYHEVLRFGRQLNRAMRTTGSDFSGSTHVPKLRQDENFKHSRENLFGAASWAGFAGTIIVIDEQPTGQRAIDILTRDGASERMICEFSDTGHLVESSQIVGRTLMDRWLAKIEADTDLSTAFIVEAGEKFRLSRATVMRWVKECTDDGRLAQIDRGLYRKRPEQ